MTTTVNGDECEFLCEPQQTLLDVLRDELGLTGTKEGCSAPAIAAPAACILDGRLVCSCLVLAVEAEGKTIETIEGHGEGRQAASAADEISSNTTACSAASARRGC